MSLVNADFFTLVRCNVDGYSAFELEILLQDDAVLASAYRAGDFVL